MLIKLHEKCASHERMERLALDKKVRKAASKQAAVFSLEELALILIKVT